MGLGSEIGDMGDNDTTIVLDVENTMSYLLQNE